jgi:hypothetical protein
MPNKVEHNAISVSKRHLESQGYIVEDVTRKRAHKGYDLVATRRQERLKIEVKGCSRMWEIPDPYITEFDKKKRRLVADFLCVVYLIGSKRPKVCMIPREAILPEYVTPKYGWRIKAAFKKQGTLERFLQKYRGSVPPKPPRRPR